MLFLTWAASVLPANHDGGRRRKNSKAVDLAQLAQLLFYRRVGLVGFIGRVSLLAVVAVASYFLGAGVAIVLLKAPVAAALLIGAALFGWASGETD